MRLALLTVMLTAGSALAQPYILTSSDGHQYQTICNENGYVLRSVSPVSRFIGTGAATQIKSRNEQVFLGRSCDAYGPDIGIGTWCWANGGVIVSLELANIVFPRQELNCAADETIGMECLC